MRIACVLTLTLALAGCASRVYDAKQLAAAPTWVAHLSYEQVDASVARPVQGAIAIVPPTVCGDRCETTLNRLAGALEEQGVSLSPEASTKLVFREISHDTDTPVSPLVMDLFSVADSKRVPFEASAQLGDACAEAARSRGILEGERLTLVASVQGADGKERAAWNYTGSDPAGLDLVYRSSQQPDKWGYVHPPPQEYNGTQMLGSGLAIGGTIAAAMGISLNRSLGGRWTRIGRDSARIAWLGVPAAFTGFVLIGKGNTKVRENPASVPSGEGFWKPVDDVFCTAEPTRIDPLQASGSGDAALVPETEPEPKPEPASTGQSSFNLVDPQPAAALATPKPAPSSALIDRAARHFAETVWETNR